MKKLKILCFHPSVAPYRVDLYNEMARHSDFQMVLLDNEIECGKFDLASCMKQLRFPYRFLKGGFNFCGRFIRTGVIKAIKETQPDVVISYEYSWVTLLLMVYRKVSGRKFTLLTMTDDNPEIIAAYRRVRSFLARLLFRGIDGMIITGNRTAEAFRARYRVPSSFKFIKIPIIHSEETYLEFSSRIRELAKAYRGKANTPKGLAVFVGRVTTVKGIDWLVDVYAKHKDALPRLLIVGEGDLSEAIRAKIAQGGLGDSIELTGFKHGDELLTLFAAADLLLLPSRFEPYGAVIGEALSWGTPCVVSNFVGAQELIEPGRNGYVFRFGDEEDLLRGVRESRPLKTYDRSLLPVKLSECVANMFTTELAC